MAAAAAQAPLPSPHPSSFSFGRCLPWPPPPPIKDDFARRSFVGRRRSRLLSLIPLSRSSAEGFANIKPINWPDRQRTNLRAFLPKNLNICRIPCLFRQRRREERRQTFSFSPFASFASAARCAKPSLPSEKEKGKEERRLSEWSRRSRVWLPHPLISSRRRMVSILEKKIFSFCSCPPKAIPKGSRMKENLTAFFPCPS